MLYSVLYEKGSVAMKLKTVMIMMVVLLLVPTGAFAMASFDFPVVAPVVSFVEGDVTVKGSGGAGWESAEAGRLLASGDTIKTGPASKAEISCATGKMRLYENTVIIVPEVVDEGEKKDVRQVELDDGTGLFKIKKRGVQNGFEVKTTNVIAGVKGTVFAVEHKKKKKITRVVVFSGVVEVTDPTKSPGTKTTLGKGESLQVEEDQGFGDDNVEDVEPGNPWRDWKKSSTSSLKLIASPSSEPPYDGGDDDDDDDDDDEPECDPVVDGGGNPIYY
jgi:hypothetical protein